jgi:hypothetical protein
MNKPIGTITYCDTGVTFGYYTEDEYIAAIDSALNYLGVTGWKYTTLSPSLELRKRITARMRDEFGHDEEGTP